MLGLGLCVAEVIMAGCLFRGLFGKLMLVQRVVRERIINWLLFGSVD